MRVHIVHILNQKNIEFHQFQIEVTFGTVQNILKHKLKISG